MDFTYKHFFAAKLHQAMIARNPIQPAFKVIDFMLFKVAKQFFKYLHQRILAFILILQVFHADTVYQVLIPFKKLTYKNSIAISFKMLKQLVVGKGF